MMLCVSGIGSCSDLVLRELAQAGSESEMMGEAAEWS
jgi:hypothetical protein